ncbi:hypothetical protein LTR53_010350 [Teratosphaeriaceae sp. CCFEE 6253]|nr:hypothetical protein LTR53_010350 [Teratosphaeriaceae sp. CCFEE 6253]
MSKKERKMEMRRAKRLLDAESIDFHHMFDEYERLWAHVAPHDSTTPLPSGDLGIKGLQDKMTLQCLETEMSGWTSKMVVEANVFLFFAKAFGLEMSVMFAAEEMRLVLEMGGEDDTAVTQLRRHLLNKEQHRWAPGAMERRTGQIGVVKPKINEVEVVVAIRDAVREPILQCTATQEGEVEGEDGDDDDDVGTGPEGEDWDMQEPDPVEVEQSDAEPVEAEPVEAGTDDTEDMEIDMRTWYASIPMRPRQQRPLQIGDWTRPSEEGPTPGSLVSPSNSTEGRHISSAKSACGGSDSGTRTSDTTLEGNGPITERHDLLFGLSSIKTWYNGALGALSHEAGQYRTLAKAFCSIYEMAQTGGSGDKSDYFNDVEQC